MRLGLTGGIGSGKTTVANLLSQHGAAIVDADAISRQATAAGGRAIEPIALAFGPEFITPDGALDRDRMRALAFSDPTARRRLEQIVHPLVGQETGRQAQAAIDAGHRCVVFDIPLLLESAHWRQRVDQVLVVDCPPGTQIERVQRRNGLGREEIERILASQASRITRLRAADHVVCNDGMTLSQLARLVQQLATRFGL
jgi:dephospho-CoA kinase